uniref:ZP-C domain-containing protein n=1 Tax=Sphenodon punctatus TaxID=8508 RepID=A0A8D0GIX1_SPHPU
MVRVHRLAGRLHVLASHRVTVSSTPVPEQELSVSRSRPPGLAYTRNPLAWAAEKGLPALTSYTEAGEANRFLVLVGMNAGHPTPPTPKIPPLPHLSEPTLEPVPGSWERSRGFPGGDSFENGQPPMPRGDVGGAMPIACAGGFSQGALRTPCLPQPPPTHLPPPGTGPFPAPPFHLGQGLLSLEVYGSEDFTRQLGPCTVPANSRVFVEATLAAYDSRLSFTIQRCAVSPSSDPALASPFVLIRGGCAIDPQVSFLGAEQAGKLRPLPPGYQERQQLSFILRPRSNDSIQFLHCRLALCTGEPQGGPIAQCRPYGEACQGAWEEEPGSGRYQRTVTKPIIVTVPAMPVGGTLNHGAAPFLAPFPPSGHRGKALKEAASPEKGESILSAPASGVELPAVVGIAFSAFVIGISLTGGLWLIHSQTDPTEPAAPRPPAVAPPATELSPAASPGTCSGH